MLNGESRGSTQTYDATIGDAYITSLDINSDADHLIYNNKAGHTDGYKGQREKLAEHTVVCPRYHLCQVAVTAIVYTVDTLCLYCSYATFMHMK
jgi:hypothetical protein